MVPVFSSTVSVPVTPAEAVIVPQMKAEKQQQQRPAPQQAQLSAIGRIETESWREPPGGWTDSDYPSPTGPDLLRLEQALLGWPSATHHRLLKRHKLR